MQTSITISPKTETLRQVEYKFDFNVESLKEILSRQEDPEQFIAGAIGKQIANHFMKAYKMVDNNTNKTIVINRTITVDNSFFDDPIKNDLVMESSDEIVADVNPNHELDLKFMKKHNLYVSQENNNEGD